MAKRKTVTFHLIPNLVGGEQGALMATYEGKIEELPITLAEYRSLAAANEPTKRSLAAKIWLARRAS